jgi:hypothetical protein
MYLLYPVSESDYYIFQIPPGQTAAQLATSFGLTMAVCAEFDMAEFDPGSENFPASFKLINRQPAANEARFDLISCKELAETIVKSNYSSLQQTSLNNFPIQTIAAQSSLAEADRLPSVQSVINQINVLAEQLDVNLAVVAAATNATEVSNATFPPTGVINIGRGAGTPSRPRDLNPSYYVEFNSTTLTEDETELYVPSTGTVIPYDPSGLPDPFVFDSTGNCFTVDDFNIQIRVAATGVVISQFVVPLNPTNQNISF